MYYKLEERAASNEFAGGTCKWTKRIRDLAVESRYPEIEEKDSGQTLIDKGI